ncbi:hypothetical protein GOZ93_17020 [Agrobacterium vitis]|nr:hypothetical protein [Agrobacterium vitis]
MDNPNVWSDLLGLTVELNPDQIRFSQKSVSDVDEIVNSMRTNGWKGDPIDVVRMPDGKLTTIDNTRLLAASRTKTKVLAVIRDANAPLPQEYISRFTTKKGVPATWGDAIDLRIGKQGATFRSLYKEGSPFTGSEK